MAGLDGQQRAGTEQRGVPGFQGAQAGIGPSTPPLPSTPEPPRSVGTVCPPRPGLHPKSAPIPFRFWLAPLGLRQSSRLGTGRTDLRTWGS